VSGGATVAGEQRDDAVDLRVQGREAGRHVDLEAGEPVLQVREAVVQGFELDLEGGEAALDGREAIV
jgi:hypothetical protein